MKQSFKVICELDKGKGIEDHTIYLKEIDNEEEIESIAKHYWIVGEGSKHGWVYYGVKSITKV